MSYVWVMHLCDEIEGVGEAVRVRPYPSHELKAMMRARDGVFSMLQKGMVFVSSTVVCHREGFTCQTCSRVVD